MKNEILKIILDINNNILDNNLKESFFKKNYNHLYNKINDLYDNSISFTSKIFLICHNINEIPKCKICNKPTAYIRFSKGFNVCCSRKCSDEYRKTNDEYKNNIKTKSLKKYGVEHPLQSKIIRNKIKETMKRKYGVEYSMQSHVIRENHKKSCLKNLGVEYPMQSEVIKEKTKKTCSKKYGVENPLLCEKIKNSVEKTNLRKFGFKNPFQSNDIKIKINETNLISRKKHWAYRLKINISDVDFNDDGQLIISNYCNKHKVFHIDTSLLNNRLRRHNINICTECNPINQISSLKEKEIKDFLIENNIDFIENNKKILSNNLELDIYIFNSKLSIEFNGLYWHSEIYKDKNYHLNKTEECEQKGIQLLHIFEDEWVNQKEIVKSIIKSKLGIFNNIILASECTIKEIDKITCSNFLNNNHIHGDIKSKIRLGLFYNDELVSVMTFNKKRITKENKTNFENEYEMHRFCTKLNSQIIYGINKLFDYFIKIYKPKTILTFVDRRYSQGNLYKQLGFIFIENIEPNYWYFNHKSRNLIRFNRFIFRKNKLVKDGFNSNKTEHEIMLEREYLRIYDSGNMKFIYNFY